MSRGGPVGICSQGAGCDLIGQTFNRSKNRVVLGVRDVSIQPGRRCTAAVRPGMARHVVSSPDLTG